MRATRTSAVGSPATPGREAAITSPTSASGGLPAGRRIRSTQWAAMAFAAPLIVYLIAFYAFPLYRNVELSVHDYTIRAFVQGNAEFVGLSNYADIITSKTFLPSGGKVFA